MMFREEDFLPISALQHFVFCTRQCALIYIERVWEENLLTAEGGIMHEKAHEERLEAQKGIRIERSVFLRSQRLGLNGIADVVEFRKVPSGEKVPFPVEYKHGKPKESDCDRVQLCAQALCLEEMRGVNIPAGALFYGKTRHREEVEFNEKLRSFTEAVIVQVRTFLQAGITPKPEYTKRCESCSLIPVCLPRVTGKQGAVEAYLRKALEP
jgi:CRISPR-associated exonuclease Cas4